MLIKSIIGVPYVQYAIYKEYSIIIQTDTVYQNKTFNTITIVQEAG